MYFYPDTDDKITQNLIRYKEPYKGYWKKSEEYMLSLAEEIFKSSKYERLFDLGAGKGRLLIRFSKYFNKIIAMEPDKKRLKAAKENVKKEGLKNIVFIQKSFLNSKLPKSYFDVVVCSHLIQHINTKDIKPTLDRIYEILKNNGILILATNHSNNDAFFKSFSDGNTVSEHEISENEFNSLIANKQNILPIHFFSIKTLKKELKKFSINKLKVFHDLYPENFLDKVIFRDCIINLFFLKKFFGRDIFIIARKE